jgi:hypothetical protein
MSHLTMLSLQAHLNNCLQIKNYLILDVVITKHGSLDMQNNVNKCENVESLQLLLTLSLLFAKVDSLWIRKVNDKFCHIE